MPQASGDIARRPHRFNLPARDNGLHGGRQRASLPGAEFCKGHSTLHIVILEHLTSRNVFATALTKLKTSSAPLSLIRWLKIGIENRRYALSFSGACSAQAAIHALPHARQRAGAPQQWQDSAPAATSARSGVSVPGACTSSGSVRS